TSTTINTGNKELLNSTVSLMALLPRSCSLKSLSAPHSSTPTNTAMLSQKPISMFISPSPLTLLSRLLVEFLHCPLASCVFYLLSAFQAAFSYGSRHHRNI